MGPPHICRGMGDASVLGPRVSVWCEPIADGGGCPSSLPPPPPLWSPHRVKPTRLAPQCLTHSQGHCPRLCREPSFVPHPHPVPRRKGWSGVPPLHPIFGWPHPRHPRAVLGVHPGQLCCSSRVCWQKGGMTPNPSPVVAQGQGAPCAGAGDAIELLGSPMGGACPGDAQGCREGRAVYGDSRSPAAAPVTSSTLSPSIPRLQAAPPQLLNTLSVISMSLFAACSP